MELSFKRYLIETRKYRDKKENGINCDKNKYFSMKFYIKKKKKKNLHRRA